MITQMLFQPFQSGLRLVEKVDQPNPPKTVSPQQNTQKPNQPNQPETGDANSTTLVSL